MHGVWSEAVLRTPRIVAALSVAKAPDYLRSLATTLPALGRPTADTHGRHQVSAPLTVGPKLVTPSRHRARLNDEGSTSRAGGGSSGARSSRRTMHRRSTTAGSIDIAARATPPGAG